jgi:ADP-heptose:LPS heptosyltransferase
MSNILEVIAGGQLGDVLLCTPIFQALKDNYPQCKIHVRCANALYRDLLVNNPYIDKISITQNNQIRLLQNPFKRRKPLRIYELDFQYIPPLFYSTKHYREHIFQKFQLTYSEKYGQLQLYFTSEEEARARNVLSSYTNPIILHVYAESSPNRHWPIHFWETLIREMPDYTFIQVGKKNEPHIAGAIDGRDQFSLRDALVLVKFTRSFVGIDSVFAHSTNAFLKHGVVLFGDTDPRYVGHSNNINLYKSLHCSPCFPCLGGYDCPYGNYCMTDITVDEVKSALLMQCNAHITSCNHV